MLQRNFSNVSSVTYLTNLYFMTHIHKPVTLFIFKNELKTYKMFLYRNSCKFPLCLIFPDKFAPWKLPYPRKIFPWRNHQQKVSSRNHQQKPRFPNKYFIGSGGRGAIYLNYIFCQPLHFYTPFHVLSHFYIFSRLIHSLMCGFGYKNSDEFRKNNRKRGEKRKNLRTWEGTR